jgi:hypothetical protein
MIGNLEEGIERMRGFGFKSRTMISRLSLQSVTVMTLDDHG